MQSPPEIVKKAKFDEPTEGGNNDWTDGQMDGWTDGRTALFAFLPLATLSPHCISTKWRRSRRKM